MEGVLHFNLSPYLTEIGVRVQALIDKADLTIASSTLHSEETQKRLGHSTFTTSEKENENR